GAEPAVLLVEQEPEDVVLAEELDDVPRKLVALVDLGRPRRDPIARELPDQVTELAPFLGQGFVRHAGKSIFQPVILENGVMRTMDPALPVAGALAIAGDRIAGGVGTHETPLASPERVDLGGRCVVPGFNDAHVHFPTWSLAQRQVRLEGTATLEETLERVAAAARDVQPGGWLRGTGWRSGDWAPPTEPTKEALDRVTGDTPAALMARDYHSLWLNSAALARANGDLEVEG